MIRAAPSSFDLVGDGDDVDLLRLTEDTFGIAITDAEAERVETFGDLLDLVDRKAPLAAPQACHLREMFKRIRDAVDGPVRPSTPLAALIRDRRPADALADLSRRTNLDLTPHLPHGRRTQIVLNAASAAIALSAVALAIQTDSAAWIAGLALALGVHLLPGLPRRLPDRIVTLGDLLRDRLWANHAGLSAQFGPGNAMDRRRALEGLCRDVAAHDGPVARDTTFITPRRRWT